MTEIPAPELLGVAEELARAAGEVLRNAYAKTSGEVSAKSTTIDLVTDADRASEELILGELSKRYPDHAVLAEESGSAREEGPVRWIIDPLDGTVNFAHRLPYFCVLIAAQVRQEEGEFATVAAATYDPLRDEMFAATEGGGASLNGEPIRVSSSKRLIDSTGITGFRYDRLSNENDNHREFCRMNFLTRGIRRMGAAGLDIAYLACGRVDLFWEYALSPWDVAGGRLLVSEAGGKMTNLVGEAHDLHGETTLGTNGTIHEAALAALRSSRDLPIGSRDGLHEHLPPELADKVKC